MLLISLALLHAVSASNPAWQWSFVDDLCAGAASALQEFSASWCSATVPLCQWPGIFCDNSLIISLTLVDVGLEMVLPSSWLSPPPSFERLTLSGCGLRGTIPYEASSTFFYVLDLSRNQLSGTLMNSFVGNQNFLNLSHNAFTGEPGICIGFNMNMKSIDLGFNQFVQNLYCPTESYSNITYWDLRNNSFYGEAPAMALPGVYLVANNEFNSIADGMVTPVPNPYNLANIEATRFSRCDVSGNPFTKTAPAWFTPYYTQCGYSYNVENTMYFPTTTTYAESMPTTAQTTATTPMPPPTQPGGTVTVPTPSVVSIVSGSRSSNTTSPASPGTPSVQISIQVVTVRVPADACRSGVSWLLPVAAVITLLCVH
jgi:hypothetical protein